MMEITIRKTVLIFIALCDKDENLDEKISDMFSYIQITDSIQYIHLLTDFQRKNCNKLLLGSDFNQMVPSSTW